MYINRGSTTKKGILVFLKYHSCLSTLFQVPVWSCWNQRHPYITYVVYAQRDSPSHPSYSLHRYHPSRRPHRHRRPSWRFPPYRRPSQFTSRIISSSRSTVTRLESSQPNSYTSKPSCATTFASTTSPFSRLRLWYSKLSYSSITLQKEASQNVSHLGSSIGKRN